MANDDSTPEYDFRVFTPEGAWQAPNTDPYLDNDDDPEVITRRLWASYERADREFRRRQTPGAFAAVASAANAVISNRIETLEREVAKHLQG